MTDEQTGAAEAQAPVPPSPPTPTPTPNRTSALVPVQTPERGLVPIPEPGPAATITLEPVTASADADRATSGDPFPREAWTTLASHAAGYLRLTVALLRDPSVSRHRRAALLAAAAYFASPIDLIPGIVPVLGQVDDLAVAMLAIRLALNALEPNRRQMHLAAAGLSDQTLHDDIVAAGRLGAWAARTGVRAGVRVGRGAVRATVEGGRAAAQLAFRARRAASRRAAPRLDQASAVARDATTSAGRRASHVRQVGAAAAGRASGAADRADAVRRRLTDRVRRRGLPEPGPGESAEADSPSTLIEPSPTEAALEPVAPDDAGATPD